jgi:mannose-6-phosphate isomerase-like protein (cupin superfamily)
VGATLDVTVTDGRGAPLEGITVEVTGPVTRQASTGAEGSVRLLGLKAGTYRLRFDGEGWITFEREAVVVPKAPALDVHVMLTAAPPAPPPPPPPVVSAPPEPPRPIGHVKVTNVADFADRNLIRAGEPQKLDVFGCTGYATTRLLQVREPMEARNLESADESLYVLAGEGTLVVGGKQEPLAPGVLAVIPRGTDSAIARRGRGPLILVSVVSGPPCAGGDR